MDEPEIQTRARLRVADLVKIAANHAGVSLDEIMGPLRTRHISRVRMAVCYVARCSGQMSFLGIGRVLVRDHTTVLHACKVVPEYMKREPEYAAFVVDITAEWQETPPFGILA